MVRTLAHQYIDADIYRDGTPSGEALERNQKDAILQRAKTERCFKAFWEAVRELRPAVE